MIPRIFLQCFRLGLRHAAVAQDGADFPHRQRQRLRIFALLMLLDDLPQPFVDALTTSTLQQSPRESQSALWNASFCSAGDMGGSVWKTASINS